MAGALIQAASSAQRFFLGGDGNTYQDTAAGGGIAIVRYELQTDGDEFVFKQVGSDINLDGWVLPRRSGAGLYARFTGVAGSPTSGDTLGVWHNLSWTRSQTVSRSVGGGTSFTFDVDISTDASGSPIVASGRIIITAVRT